MKKKYLIPAFACFLFLISCGYILHLHSFIHNYWGFAIGDWFVNFDAGFVRRGLSGFFILHLSDLLHVQPGNILFAIQIVFYSGYILFFLFLLFRKKINDGFVIAFLSPATILFTTFDPNAAGRKEIILFFLFALYLLLLKKKKINSTITIAFSFALAFSTLFHELTFFFTPYFVLAAYINSKLNNQPFQFFKSVLIVAGSWLSMIPIILLGNTINGYVICSGLKQRGLPESICNGILSWPANYGWKDVRAFATESNYLYVYGISFLLALIPFLLFVRSCNIPFITQKKFLGIFVLLLIFSSPLFLFAVDWGRWINIHFMLLLYTSTFLLKDKLTAESSIPSDDKVSLPGFRNAKSGTSKKISNGLFILLAISYIAFWTMPHFGPGEVFSLTKNFYSVKHMLTDLIKAL